MAEEEGLEPSFEAEDEEPAAPIPAAALSRAAASGRPYEEPRPPRSYRGLARLAVVLFVLAGLIATVSWQWSNITGVYQLRHAYAIATEPDCADAGGQSQIRRPGSAAASRRTGAGAGAPGQQAGPEVAQRVVLYEEDPNDPQGKRFVGSAVWRTDTVSPGSGLAPELEVRADITVPERT